MKSFKSLSTEKLEKVQKLYYTLSTTLDPCSFKYSSGITSWVSQECDHRNI